MAELTPQNQGNGHEQANTSNEITPSTSDGREIESNPSIAAPRRSEPWERRIQKVPALLRQEEHNKREYDPVVVSFGPYHHGKPELKLAEDFKPMALNFLVAGSGKSSKFFFDKVREVISRVRRCYVENSTDQYDDDTFTQMMLHDACFMICKIAIAVNNEKDLWEASVDHLGSLSSSLIARDMFLLENQIPLWLLKLLIGLKYKNDEGQKMLSKFLGLVISGEYKLTSDKEVVKPMHLLEDFRRLLVEDFIEDDKTNRWSTLKYLNLLIASIGNCLTQFPRLWRTEKPNRVRSLRKYVHSFRSVTDLKAKGIKFKPSPTDSFKDIKFKSSYFSGELQLPTWGVSIYTKVFFLNMIAFEMCPNNKMSPTVSTYINFMKSLIESPEDVKELREKKIIFNMLGSDEEVLKVYNDINTFGVENPHIYYMVKEKIQKHYNSKAKTWVAELIHTYFSSPWSVIALLVALFLLCSTIFKTYFKSDSTKR